MLDFISTPLREVLVTLVQYTGNLGLAIIALTVALKLVLLPITLPSLKAAEAMRLLQPEIEKLKRQFGKDKVGLQAAQMDLFKKHKINPAAGCLPQIFQMGIFIVLYQVFMSFLQNQQAISFPTTFLWLDLTKADPWFVLPVLSSVTQFILGIMLLPALDTSAAQVSAANTPDKKDDQEATDMTSMAASMQQQMLYIMPVMMFFFTFRFPSGLVLYWFVSTLISLLIQARVSGWGGIARFAQSVAHKFSSKSHTS
jgi:YidC/Oxa1 family membrane protein insertase